MNEAATHRPKDHPDVRSGRIGVLLINLGTPDATDPVSIRRYLKEFLSDRRVIEIPRLIWWPILNGIILRTRPKKSGEAYAKIWNRERDESPLRTITRDQAADLAKRLEADGVLVDWAMRYGQPAIGERIAALQKAGADRILLAPLYPQYSASTTATANDKAFEALKKMRWQPAIRTLPPYHDDPAYIDALALSIEASLTVMGFEPEVVLVSFHGLPRSYLDKGDPYYCHCRKTVRLLRGRLGWSEERMPIAFQSRFGRAEWLQPYTDETIVALARKGVRNLATVSPGFSADCIETLEEMGMQNRDLFLENGGQNYALIPCLNDSRQGMDLIETLVRRELGGWL